ncbi:Gfo/Idh/MocA family protein [Paenibacillus montanisoli]|uniref:Gfo/Idh/MocA family oxidoreductase n=1 Tax=Paenibacillus montanisoli TaxID=2081970 RepID=A0A328TU81_9BACL|nr:Gfo/Idh/MocA family oxidoreductase [Paenibacillus montanisoli]RAP73172.1 gfo/Idh/MocA family oxidoreductase [Paenibacillus montanisoli]
MIKVGLIGFGFMGRMHFDNYVRLMKEGSPVELKAICDIQIEELKNGKAIGNIATDQELYDLSPFNLYTNIEDMIANEELDMIDITLPTGLHAQITCSMLEKGYHVLCEKPIARTAEQAWQMVETANQTGKKLMIGQCLRFWPAYEYAKACVEDGRYGKPFGGSFFRGSGLPAPWFLDGSKSGGCLMDMHIHDTDMVHWLFGAPDKVSTIARNVIPGSGYDIVSTHYVYDSGLVLNAQADWTLQGDFGFEMSYRINFEGGNLIFANNQVKVNPNEGPSFIAELSEDMGYYFEIRSFIEALANGTELTVCTAESAARTLDIIEAEQKSADNGGAFITL